MVFFAPLIGLWLWIVATFKEIVAIFMMFWHLMMVLPLPVLIFLDDIFNHD